MTFKIYGVGSVQAPDKVGETVNLEGLDTTNLRYLSDEHATTDKGGGMFALLGAITSYKKIFKQEDAQTPRQKRCWDASGQKPFLYFEAELLPTHPNAESAQSLIQWCAQHPEHALKIGASIEGGIMRRGENDPKHLEQTVGEGIALTIKPMMPNCSVFPMLDLQKSDVRVELPTKYVEMLQQSSSGKGFVELKKSHQIEILSKRLEQLKKSTEAMTSSMRCNHCGKTATFFIGSDTPNRCPSCSAAFSMTSLWKAVTKSTKDNK